MSPARVPGTNSLQGPALHRAKYTAGLLVPRCTDPAQPLPLGDSEHAIASLQKQTMEYYGSHIGDIEGRGVYHCHIEGRGGEGCVYHCGEGRGRKGVCTASK